MKDQHPARSSTVTVTFQDGEVKTYQIAAGGGISQYLAQQAGSEGVLTLLNGPESHCIPVSEIREWRVLENPITT